jgi:UDP-N-acetylmuramate dehydrogenase
VSPESDADAVDGRPDGAGGESFDVLAAVAELQRRIGVKTVRGDPLARHTTMRCGGPADIFVTARNPFELRALVRFARERHVPLTLLGRGSDVVVSDRGIRGLVVQVRAEASRLDGERYVADAGMPMARAATETQHAGLTGLEFGLAIPGTVGGAVWANAGAHDADIAAILESADVLLADGRIARLPAAELGLGYRTSRLKETGAPDPGDPTAPFEVVLSATFHLRPAEPPVIRERLDEIRTWRRDHQPLGLPSAGSVFRNPPGEHSAGWLIDQAGLKGLRIRGAAVSEKHANFIVNDGKGPAADVRRLVDRVRGEVEAAHGVRLEEEIVFLGDWSDWPWPEPES